MTSSRRRSPLPVAQEPDSESIEGTSNVSESEEQDNLEEFLEVTANDTFEMIKLMEEKVETANFVEECIVPTEDPGLRFIPVSDPVATPVKIREAVPKRHPRNIPKFSRTANE